MNDDSKDNDENKSETSSVAERSRFFNSPKEFIEKLQEDGIIPRSIPETCLFLSSMKRELPEKHEDGKRYNDNANRLLFAIESVLTSTIKNRHYLANGILLLKRETGFTLGEISEALEKVTGSLFSNSWVFRLGRNGETFEKHPELMQIRDQEVVSRLSSLKPDQLAEVVKLGRINGKVSIYDGTRDEIVEQVQELKRASSPNPLSAISDAALSFFRITKEIQAAKDLDDFAQYAGFIQPIADAFCLLLIRSIAANEKNRFEEILQKRTKLQELATKIIALNTGHKALRSDSKTHESVRKAVFALHDVSSVIASTQGF